MAKTECLQSICLQQKTGSCHGCNIMEMIVNKTNQGQPLEETARKVAERYCPNPNVDKPQTHLIKARRATSMGQDKSNQVEIRR
jgi:hypothetical protein